MIEESYREVTEWLFSQLPMYQRTGGANYKIDLEKTHQLMELLGHPEKGLTCIHVAGTNGKGSVSHMLASIFQEAGFRTGLYTSPHLVDFRERVRINGITIPEEDVIEFVRSYKKDFERLSLSFFEMTVGLAFWYFRKSETEMAIVEVGMGGRLDSTNVVLPELSIITNIGLDHTSFLGREKSTIAGEKGGIIKPGIPVVIGERDPETEPVFMELARNKKAPIIFAEDIPMPDLISDLKGGYQRKNIRTVWAGLKALKDWDISDDTIVRGLQKVRSNTGLRGRWEILYQKPLVIADTGHNVEGISEVIAHLSTLPHRQLHMVIGMVNDKDRLPVLNLLPKKGKYYATQPSIPRACSAEDLYSDMVELGLSVECIPDVRSAVQKAYGRTGADDILFIGGSTFVVADLLTVEDEIMTYFSKGPKPT